VALDDVRKGLINDVQLSITTRPFREVVPPVSVLNAPSLSGVEESLMADNENVAIEHSRGGGLILGMVCHCGTAACHFVDLICDGVCILDQARYDHNTDWCLCAREVLVQVSLH
jgi:hypothetical protein